MLNSLEMIQLSLPPASQDQHQSSLDIQTFSSAFYRLLRIICGWKNFSPRISQNNFYSHNVKIYKFILVLLCLWSTDLKYCVSSAEIETYRYRDASNLPSQPSLILPDVQGV